VGARGLWPATAVCVGVDTARAAAGGAVVVRNAFAGRLPLAVSLILAEYAVAAAAAAGVVVRNAVAGRLPRAMALMPALSPIRGELIGTATAAGPAAAPAAL
jgi:hypothetical protein